MSWEQLQKMPLYVRRVWWDCAVAERAAENARAEQEQLGQQHDGFHVRR